MEKGQQGVKAATLHLRLSSSVPFPRLEGLPSTGLSSRCLTQKHRCVPAEENHKSLFKSVAGFGGNSVTNSSRTRSLAGGQNCRAVKHDGRSATSVHLSLGEARGALGDVPTVPKAFLLRCTGEAKGAAHPGHERPVLSVY